MAETKEIVNENTPLVPEESKLAAQAIGKLLFFSVLMFTFPFLGFYGTKLVLRDYFTIVGFNNTVFSVAVAVVIVNMIIGVYAYQAFNEPDDGDKKERKEGHPKHD